jgi:hypothetical protein
MTMDASEQSETVLVIDANGRLLPRSTFAFRISQGRKPRVEQLYKNSLIIYRNGAVKRITRIDFLEFWGRTIGQRLLSAANGGIRRA